MKLVYPVKCPTCEYEGESLPRTPFNWFLAVVLLFLGIIPGVIYIAFVKTQQSRFKCPRCSSPSCYATGEPKPAPKVERKLNRTEMFIVAIPIILIILMIALNQ
ncbi:hypothetical protein GW777_01070 [Candidatus Peregrinibacteria bacterium]|nr:hypothetical protein [Candidatus Parcubacteria bacterium]NCS66953.1 hypothetical protein [Candidatus Peregrinibacteria bacterium]